VTISDVTLETVNARIRELLAALLGVDPASIADSAEILADADSGGLGLDSLDVLMLAIALADEYGLSDPVEIDWNSIVTVKDAAAFVHRLATSGHPQFT
jgi:acyl carrier protein